MSNFNYTPATIPDQIPDLLRRIAFAREISTAAEAKSELLDLYTRMETSLEELHKLISEKEFSLEHAGHLAKTLDKVGDAFPRNYTSPEMPKYNFNQNEKETQRHQQERDQYLIEEALKDFNEAFDFFDKLDFLNRDLVIIGANGSGKTFLANHIKKHIKDSGVIVSAQRILVLPEFTSIKGHQLISSDLKNIQAVDKTNKNENTQAIQNEFSVLIEFLISDNTESQKEYKRRASENVQQGKSIDPPIESTLDKIIRIWNSIFEVQKISIDGINIKVQNIATSYSVSKMSEGEKVILFLLAQVFLSPSRGFIIVDEPEMYLHPSLHRKFWDALENERTDTVFIYITHDLEFAANRIHAKKLWLRSFTFPEKFKLEEIPKNEIPQSLLLELLGSQQDVLFCEGVVGSLDEQLYSILFPKHIIKPVGGCSSVISFTKAFNRLPSLRIKAVGIIDSDFQSPNRLSALKSENIYSINVSEVENILLDEKLLIAICESKSLDIGRIATIKETVMRKLAHEQKLQISRFVSAKVDHYFKDTNVPRGNDISTLKLNYSNFLDDINLDTWAAEREKVIDQIIKDNDYKKALQIFHDKGLESVAKRILKVNDYHQQALQTLRNNSSLQSHLLTYIPAI